MLLTAVVKIIVYVKSYLEKKLKLHFETMNQENERETEGEK